MLLAVAVARFLPSNAQIQPMATGSMLRQHEVDPH